MDRSGRDAPHPVGGPMTTIEVKVRNLQPGDIVTPTMRTILRVEQRAALPASKREVTLRGRWTKAGEADAYLVIWGAETVVTVERPEVQP